MKFTFKLHNQWAVRCVLAILFAGILFAAKAASAQEENTWNLPPAPASAVKTPADDAVKVTSGKFIVERPTLVSAGFEWMIHGDSNRNSKVEVSYRKKGATAWRPALPLMRLQFESIQEEP